LSKRERKGKETGEIGMDESLIFITLLEYDRFVVADVEVAPN
jgi:hypothetical protein